MVPLVTRADVKGFLENLNTPTSKCMFENWTSINLTISYNRWSNNEISMNNQLFNKNLLDIEYWRWKYIVSIQITRLLSLLNVRASCYPVEIALSQP